MRLVLDTNVWLDWLIFDDPTIIPLKTAREGDSVDIVIDEPCRDELVRVLAYPKFNLDDQSRADMLGQVDRLSQLLVELGYPSQDRLPYCSDPDDVKFLSLACASNADWLITKDNALLSTLRKKNRASISIQVATPELWALSALGSAIASD